jgi:hypothetical protein
MYRVSAIIDDDILLAKREVIRKAPGEMGLYARRVIQPRLNTEVQRRIVPYPGRVSKPFEFATDKSRRYYFASRKGRLPYRRTGRLKRGWQVRIDLRRNEGLISIYNLEPYAVYVYGPGFLRTSRRQVPGHKRTGWGKNLDREIIAISQIAQNLLIDGWYKILTRRRR